MTLIVIILMIAACICLAAYAFNLATKVRANLLGLGMLFWALAVTLPLLTTVLK